MSQIDDIIDSACQIQQGELFFQYILEKCSRRRVKKAEPQIAHPLKPALGLLVKLGSIAVHTEEMLSPRGHVFDKTAVQQLLADPEVKDWLARMDFLAMLPKKR